MPHNEFAAARRCFSGAGSQGDDISSEPLAGLANNLSALALNMLTLSTSGRVV